MNFSTLCTIFVTFGPETPEFTLYTVNNSTFRGDTAKIGIGLAYHVKYLRMSWTYLDLL